MHSLFRKIDESVHRRRSLRSRPRSELLSHIETLEQRIALTANVYLSQEDGDTAGFAAIVLDESGDDLYLRQTVGALNGAVTPRLDIADNPEFTSASSYAFATNDLPGANNNYQDLFVSFGVANTHSDTDLATANPDTTLPTALSIGAGTGTLPAGMQADPTWAVTPGTLGGGAGFQRSSIIVSARDATSGNIGFDGVLVDTQNLFDMQDGSVDQLWPLVFTDPQAQGTRLTTYTLDFGPDDVDDAALTGTVNLATGVVSLQLRATGGGNYADDIVSTTFDFSYASPVIAEDPSFVTVAPGNSLDVGFSVDLPAPDSVVTINSPINSPNRDTAVNGLVELRSPNIVVNAPVVANDGVSVLQSRFLNAANVESSVTADVFSSDVVNIDPADAALVNVGAQVFGPGEAGRLVPQLTNVVAVDAGTGDITLSQVVSFGAGRELRFFNPSSSPTYDTTPVTPLVESARVVLTPSASNFDIQPGAVVGPLGAIETDTYVPLNTRVAAVDTATGVVYLTRPISLPAVLSTLQFFNPSTDATLVESFEATAAIQADEFTFDIANDTSSDLRDRGRLFIAGSSSLSGVGGGSANLLAVTANSSDIVFEGAVTATNQAYFFETTVAETPFSFTTKNSADISAGNIAATNLEVTLSSMSPAETANSVMHVVDLDTTVTSMQVSAGSYASQSPPFLQPGPDNDNPITGPFPFDVTVRETDALTLDTDLSSGGPVAISTGGELSLTASIQSSSDLSLTSSGGITGTAELATTNGQINLTGTGVSLAGLIQVIDRPYDGFSTDVSVTASNGSVSLGQGVRAVNKIVIDQQSTTGSVQSSGLLSAYDIQVFSEGDVDIDTSASFVDVSVASAIDGTANTARTVTVDSDRDSQFRISTAGGTASVSAQGVDNDNGTPGDTTDDIAALSLELRETAVLSATAPQGSIDVIAVTSDELVMGVAADLLQGNAANMQAAGSVEIRTTQSPVTVLDAAVAGRGQLQVRAAATGNLTGDYEQNTPGITPSTITASADGSINGAALASFGGLDAATNPLRFRDLVLLSSQTSAEENGVYQVINLGNASTPWQLRRYGLAETTSELPVGTRVYITDGNARGETYRVNAYDNTINSTPLRVTPGMTRSQDEIAVRFATASILDGTFDGAGTINGTALGAGIPLRINETPVQDGDLVLVQFGALPGGTGNSTPPSSVANGVYQVTTSTDAWVLTRYNNIELPGSPTVEEATVVVLEGFYRTSRSGQTFDIAYDGLGLVDLTIADDSANIVSAIGSYDPRDTTTLVVSTAGATNDSSGSLGKMLTLAQANEAQDLVGQNILQELNFGNVLGSVTGNTGTIVLQQELPVIEKPIVIDASQRYTLDASTTSQVLVIDGSRITTSSESTFVTRGTEVNGLVLGPTASADTTDIFRPLPSTVSSLRFGGFEQGAAVVVDGASNVLLDNLTIGQNSNDASQAVRYGVRVTGTSGVDGPVSIVGGSITSANIPTNSALAASPTSPLPITNFLDGAGVLLDDAAENVQIVGTNVGSSNAANLVGVLARSSNLAASGGASTFNSVGASEIGSFVTPTVLNLFTLTVPALDVQGNDIDIDDVFVGQSVTGSEFLAGTVVVAVDKLNREVTLNQAAILTNAAATVAFGTPTRTSVENNFWGLMLESGATRVVNSDIANNIYDGVFIGTLDGAVNDFNITIGSSTTAGPNSNAIYSNGRNGIRFAENIESSTGGTEITIQGNYIGSAVGSAFVGNTQGSYFWEGNGLPVSNPLSTAFASLGYDSVTNDPIPPAYISTDALFSALITPVSVGGDVDSDGNENADFVDGGSTAPPSPPGPPPPTNPFA